MGVVAALCVCSKTSHPNRNGSASHALEPGPAECLLHSAHSLNAAPVSNLFGRAYRIAVTPYGVVTFLSDLGGFLNLLTVALLFLFPLAFKATEPRTFIVLMLADKWRARKGQGMQQQQEQGQDQREMTQRQNGGHGEAQSQSQPPSSLCIDMAPLASPPLGEAEAAAAGEQQRLDVSVVPSDTMQL